MNFAGIKTPSIINKRYIYIDYNKYAADHIFIENKMRVKFCTEWEKDGYRIIMVKIKRKDNKKFLKCMMQLDKKMMLLYGTKYIDMKILIFKELTPSIRDYVTENLE